MPVNNKVDLLAEKPVLTDRKTNLTFFVMSKDYEKASVMVHVEKKNL